MRRKFYFTIHTLLLSLTCLAQCLTAQNVPVAAAEDDFDKPLQKCWEFESVRLSAFPPLSDNARTIFQILDDGSLTAIDASAGKTVWRSDFGGEIVSNALFEDRKLYLVSKIIDESATEFVVRSVSAATGLTLWQKSLSLNDSSRIFVFNGAGSTLIIVSETGQILSVDKTDGAEKWRKSFSTAVTAAPFLFENKLFIGTTENKIQAFSTLDGETLATMDLRNSPSGNFFVSAAAIIIGDRAGGVTALRASDRKILWRARTGAQIVDITEISGNFLISSNDGFVYLLAAKTGDRIWKKRLPGRPIGKPLVRNNFALLQTIDGAAALVLDLSSGKPVNQILFGENVFSAGSALFVNRRVVIQTNTGLFAYGSICDEK